MRRAYVSPLREEQAEATRTRVLEAVARVLARGVVELSVPSVASEARVSVATVYRHFPTKSDLIHGLARHVIELPGAGWRPEGAISLDKLEATWLEILQLRARVDPALRQAMVHPEMNRARVEDRQQRRAHAVKGLEPLVAHLPPRDRRRATDMLVLLSSSLTSNAWETLIGSSLEEEAATLAWAIRRIIGRDSS